MTESVLFPKEAPTSRETEILDRLDRLERMIRANTQTQPIGNTSETALLLKTFAEINANAQTQAQANAQAQLQLTKELLQMTRDNNTGSGETSEGDGFLKYLSVLPALAGLLPKPPVTPAPAPVTPAPETPKEGGVKAEETPKPEVFPK